MQRKVFRIEQMAGDRRARAPAPAPAPDAPATSHELACIRETLADNMRALSTLLHEGKERRMTRAAGELGAAVDAMEKSTHKILQSAEIIDDCAKALAAAQKTDFETGLTQDIQDHLVRIYEACNFHDLAGQRIGKVIGTLGLVEDRLADMIARATSLPASAGAPAAEPRRELINGPRLDGDSGHARQRDIDALFD